MRFPNYREEDRDGERDVHIKRIWRWEETEIAKGRGLIKR
jgi:hypothetical protein